MWEEAEHQMPAHALEKLRRSRFSGFSPQTHDTTERMLVSASGDVDIDPIQHIESDIGAQLQFMDRLTHAAAGIAHHRRHFAGRIEDDGRARPMSSVEMADMDLKPPLPMTTSEWVGPSWQGSISSWALPPWPQVFGLSGSNRSFTTLS